MSDQPPTPRDHVTASTPDITTERLAALRDLFPEAFTEGKLDIDKFKAAAGLPTVEGQADRYSFSWAGKRDALQLLKTPSSATLIPAPEESVDWDNTHNLFIEGDNLEVLKLLYKSYFGQVKMIYIDPPYNTGNDFVYPDDYSDPIRRYLEITGQVDMDGNLLASNPETGGRYHSTWLTMLYPHLFLARQLLSEEGVIYVSIDDHEIHNLRLIMNEIFGEENLVATIIWQKVYSPRMDAKSYSTDHDYILAYKRGSQFEVGRVSMEQNANQFSRIDDATGKRYRARSLRKEGSMSRRVDRPNLFYSLLAPDGTNVFPIKPDGTEGRWRWAKSKYDVESAKGLVEWIRTDSIWQVYVKQFLDEDASRPPTTIWPHTEVGHNHEAVEELRSLFGEPPFNNPKPTRLIKKMLKLSTNAEDMEIVLDFFAGSGTIAHAVLDLNREDGGNRRFIAVQFPEPTTNVELPTIADITKERIRRVITRMEQEQHGKLDLTTREAPEDLGFRVFKLAPSDFLTWRPPAQRDTNAYANQMALFTGGLDDEWKPENVIWEVALKEGFSLSSEVLAFDHVRIPQNTIYRVDDYDKGQHFFICLDEHLQLESVQRIGLKKDDLFICRDIAIDDTIAANLSLQCRLKTI